MDQPTDIFSYITLQEANYKIGISVMGKWDWSMKEHIEQTVLYKHSQLLGDKLKGTVDELPVKNITRSILNLAYRAEGFDVKDIQLFVDDATEYYKSFLIRKYHEKWAREHGLDTVIDQMVESFVDFGGALLKDTRDGPQVVQLQTLAFCDQSNLLAGPFAIKHPYSPAQLLEQAKLGWGDTKNGADYSLDEAIYVAESARTSNSDTGQKDDTPGKWLEVYEVHGTLPAKFLNSDAPDTYIGQMQIVLMYTDKGGKRKGITLFKGKEKNPRFKLVLRDEIFGRALGFGGAEELFEPQMWTNFSMVHKKAMLEAASKIILHSDDPTVTTKNKVRDMDNLQVLELAPGASIGPVDTTPRNAQFFDSFDAEWAALAREMGSATGALLGNLPTNHTAYNTLSLATSQGQAIHDYRKGKLSTFWEGVEREWVLPRVVSDFNKGQEFLVDLSPDELESVADQVVSCQANSFVLDLILKGHVVTDDIVTQQKQKIRDQFLHGGSKRFIKALENELADVPVDITIVIANKQKDVAGMLDKMTKTMQLVFSTYNPQTGQFAALADKRLATWLNQIFEYSGFSPIQYSQGSSPSAPKTSQASYPQVQPPNAAAPPGAVPAAPPLVPSH